jgi:hypothetical protein
MTTPGSNNAHRTQRRRHRRTARGGTRIECLRGTMGLGRNLAVSLINVSEIGACLVLREELNAGQEVEVHFVAASGGRTKLVAVVVWVSPASNTTYTTGLQFRTPLSYSLLQDVSRSPTF